MSPLSPLMVPRKLHSCCHLHKHTPKATAFAALVGHLVLP